MDCLEQLMEDIENRKREYKDILDKAFNEGIGEACEVIKEYIAHRNALYEDYDGDDLENPKTIVNVSFEPEATTGSNIEMKVKFEG